MASHDSVTARVYEAMSKDRSLSNSDLVASIHGATGSIPNYDTVKKARRRFLDGHTPTHLPASKANGQPRPCTTLTIPESRFQPDQPQMRGTVGQAIRDVLAAVVVLGVDGVRALVDICGAKE